MGRRRWRCASKISDSGHCEDRRANPYARVAEGGPLGSANSNAARGRPRPPPVAAVPARGRAPPPLPDAEDDYSSEDEEYLREMPPNGGGGGGTRSVPAIFKAGGLTVSTVVSLAGVHGTAGCLHAILAVGAEEVDARVGYEGAVKVHFVVGDERPQRLSRSTPWREVRDASAFIVTPNKM